MKGLRHIFDFSRVFSGENRKPTMILLWTPFIPATWRCYGTKPFYLQHLASRLVLFENVSRTAELYTFFSSFLLLGVLTLAIIRYVLKEPLRSYGLALGDWRFSLAAFAIIAPVMVLLTIPAARDAQFLAEYPLDKGAGASATAFIWHAVTYLFSYISWEVYFRGFMQFGLRDKFGPRFAILIQTAVSCIVHIGKPDGEIYSSILGALIWGVVAHRSDSILAPVLTHWALGVALDYFISFPLMSSIGN